MRLVKQFAIIAGISFLGEFLRYIIPLPIPASIYGLVIMLGALQFGILEIEKVRDAGRFLIEIMPLMFIPPAVGLLACKAALKKIWLPVLLITLLTTILVMGVAGRTTQFVIKKKEEKKHE